MNEKGLIVEVIRNFNLVVVRNDFLLFLTRIITDTY